MLGLTHTLALSPVNYELREEFVAKSIWSEAYCSEKMPGPFISCLDLAPINLQLVDPFFYLDFYQAGLFASAGKIDTIKIPFVAHDTISLLRSSARLMQVFDHLLAQEFDEIGKLLNVIRRQASERANNLASACLARGQRSRAENLWQKARENGVSDRALHEARNNGLVENLRRWISGNTHLQEAKIEDRVKSVSFELVDDFGFQKELVNLCDQYGQIGAAVIPARLALQCASSTSDRAKAALALSHLCDRQGRGEEAFEYARLAQTEEPENLNIILHLARLANDLGKQAEAEGAYAQALRHASTNLDRAMAALALSHLYDRQGRGEEAFEYARLAEAEQPEDFDIVLHLARLANDLGKQAEAEAAYTQALRHASTNLDRAKAALALSHHLAVAKKIHKALDAAEVALAATPASEEILLQIGHLRLRKGDRLGTLKVIQELRSLVPNDHADLLFLSSRSQLIPFKVRRLLRILAKVLR